MIKKIIIFLGIIILLSGCFEVVSDTEIQINNLTKEEYEEIKKDIQNFVTNLKEPLRFDCDYDNKTWKSYRDAGKMMCKSEYFGRIFVYKESNNTKVIYDGQSGFWIPTKEEITDEHKVMQGILLGLGYHFQQKYNKDVKVIFYHKDLPEEGKQLF